MDYTLENGNKFIIENKNKINTRYRLKYHMMPPIGWMNDPNGLVYYKNEFHLFYQHYPYDSNWGPMHWGHFKSNNLIKYEDLPLALAPTNQAIESGCFSGGAIVCNEKIYLAYTRHYEKENYKREEICLAESSDGINFVKQAVPIFDNATLPANLSRSDFRDPYICFINGKYYIFIGGKDITTNEGVIIILKGDNIYHFEYDFFIGPYYELGYMGECPSYKRVNGVDVILVSGCGVVEKNNCYKNANSSVFIIGNIDFENKKMNVKQIKEIDKGDTFYAPQFISSFDEPIMIGWFEMWEKKYPTNLWNDNWVGAFSLPRKLEYIDGNLYQRPVFDDSYLSLIDGNLINREGLIKLEAASDFELKLTAINGDVKIIYNKGILMLDTANSNNLNPCIRHTSNKYSNINAEIYLDTSGIEIFINGGIETISSRIYLDSSYKIDLVGNAVLKKYNIEVK